MASSSAQEGLAEMVTGGTALENTLNSIMATAGSVFMSPAQLVSYGYVGFQMFTGKEVNPYSSWFAPSQVQSVRGAISDNIKSQFTDPETGEPNGGGQLLSMMYNGACSGLDSVYNGALVGNALSFLDVDTIAAPFLKFGAKVCFDSIGGEMLNDPCIKPDTFANNVFVTRNVYRHSFILDNGIFLYKSNKLRLESLFVNS